MFLFYCPPRPALPAEAFFDHRNEVKVMAKAGSLSPLPFHIALINPLDIKALVTTNEFKRSQPRYPEKKKELEKLANSLQETDNPVLMLVRLKK